MHQYYRSVYLKETTFLYLMLHNIFFILEQNAVNQEKKLLQANECRFTRENFFLQITNLYFISSNFISKRQQFSF